MKIKRLKYNSGGVIVKKTFDNLDLLVKYYAIGGSQSKLAKKKQFTITKKLKKGKELSLEKVKRSGPYGSESNYRITFKKRF